MFPDGRQERFKIEVFGEVFEEVEGLAFFGLGVLEAGVGDGGGSFVLEEGVVAGEVVDLEVGGLGWE